MPAYECEVAILLRSFDDDTYFAEGLLFGEVSRYGDDSDTLKKAIVRTVTNLVEAEDLTRLYTHGTPPEIESFDLTLSLEPHPLSAWRAPIYLRLDVVRWSQERGHTSRSLRR
jgi:hypothetical protein